MKIIKYIMLPAVIIIMLIFTVTNSEGLNYWLTWGGNRAAWIYSDSGYIYPSLPIRMKAGDSLKYNGVTVTSGTGGGGIAASDNTTFTGRNTFTDGSYFTDSVNVTGAILKADSIRVTKNLLLGTTSKMVTVANVMYLLENGYQFQTTYASNLMALDSLNGLTLPYGNIIPASGKGLYWDAQHRMYYTNPTMYYKSNFNSFITNYSYSLLDVDSATGLTLSRGAYNGSGSGLYSLNASNLSTGTIDTARIPNTAKIDTSKFARLDTLTTERVKSKTEFSDIVTFFLSPVFSALVNFANGITTTTITASSTATFNGDQVNTGWKNQGTMATRFKYYKDTVLFMYLGASPPFIATTFTVAHGVPNWKSITQAIFLIHDDSLNYNILPNVNALNAAVGYGYSIAGTDSLNAYVRIPAAGVNLFNDTCTISIRYSDYAR